MRAEYEAAFREARRFRISNMAWDPLLRAASAGYLDNRPAMVKAYRELTEQFPDVASDPTETIRKYFHFDQWVDAMLKGLE